MKTRKHWKSLLLGLLIGILCLQTSVFADVDTLVINQIIQKGNNVFVYVSGQDANGRATGDVLSKDAVSVTINNKEPLFIKKSDVIQSLDRGTTYVMAVDVSNFVTEAEMTEIKQSILDFIDQMGSKDCMKIITMGDQVMEYCDYTGDRGALRNIVQNNLAVNSNSDASCLYEGITYILREQRKKRDSIPRRTAMVVFTDGTDKSDGSYSESMVDIEMKEAHIPVYVVGIKGQNPNPIQDPLAAVGRIAKRTGGGLYSYSSMSCTEAMQTIANLLRSTYRLQVKPEDKYFGKQSLEWTVTYSDGSYSIRSTPYVYPLTMEDVELATPTPEPTNTPMPTPTDTPAPTPTPIVLPTTAPTIAPTQPAESTQPAVSTPTPEPAGTDKVMGFLKQYWMILVPGAVIGLALIIILIVVLVLHNKKKNSQITSYDSQNPNMYPPSQDEYTSETLWDDEANNDRDIFADDDDEKTTGVDDFDDEATVDGSEDKGIKLEFEISFDGYSVVEQHSIRDQLVLGRGNECDVDVVLHSHSEERKQTSRKHAILMLRPDGLYIKDNSRNKTYVNGREVADEQPIKNEDVLQLGRATVKVRILMDH